MAGLRDRRNRLLASASFQTWAAKFPLIRGVARSKAQSGFDLVAGFVYSQILLACVELDLFKVLEGGPQTLGALAQRFSLSRDAAERLMDAAVSLDLAERRGEGIYALGATGAAILSNPAIVAMVRHHRHFYDDLRDPLALLRGEVKPTALSRYWAYAKNSEAGDLPPGAVTEYTALMAQSQSLVASEILDAYPMQGHTCLLDIGGGDGTFLRAAAARNPHLELMLFDLPAVGEIARERFADAGLAGKANVYSGSFFEDALPAGADIATFVRVLHDHDDEAVRNLLAAAKRALPPGATLLIAEPMSGNAGANRMSDAYFAFYLMSMGSGRARTPAALFAMLEQAGFQGSKKIPTRISLQTSLIAAIS